ncbi:MAG: universal stress protein UspA [Thaumarchaeota archaeon]|nr:MAG: universal stress protein UspA [Nitrososphaerota archaeon]
MLEYKNILVPHAGTKTGDIALEKAIDIAKECNGKITILNVVESLTIPLDLISDVEQKEKINELTYTSRSFKKIIFKKMEKHVLRCKREKVDAVTKITHGNPDEEILRFYNDNPVDLIVMAKKRDSDQKTFLKLGSNTRKILECVTCPILIVGNKKE